MVKSSFASTFLRWSAVSSLISKLFLVKLLAFHFHLKSFWHLLDLLLSIKALLFLYKSLAAQQCYKAASLCRVCYILYLKAGFRLLEMRQWWETR